jgi:uncharacterized lipoprotein YddW (UPF0748 family)
MTKNLKYLSILAIILLFAACHDKNDNIVEPPVVEENIMPNPEFRGVWVATAFEIDWPMGKYGEAEQKQLYIDYLDKFVETNVNAIFFQVRPMADAFYDSQYESWSKTITGTAGQDPGYDVLQFLINEAHARGIEFHAWLNPYRIATRTSASVLFPTLDTKINPDWIKDYDMIRIYNPALPEVQDRIINIVKDILVKYDVDGIHVDDYFYPDPSYYSNLNDTAEYRIYGSEYETIDSFRFANVDKVIKRMHETVIATRPGAIFSVSPTPSMSYNKTLYANVVKWYEKQWADVLIPQLYQVTGAVTTSSTFNNSFDTWYQFYKTKVALLIGHALYKIGDGSSAGFQTTKELIDQFAIVRRKKSFIGSVLYNANSFLVNDGHGRIEIIDVLKTEIFKNPAVRPFIGRKTVNDPTPPTNAAISGSTLTWSVASGLTSVVYVIPDGETKAQAAAITAANTYPISVKGKYFVTTVNKDNVESEKSNEVEYI